MGIIDTLLGALFGGSRNVVRETVEVFRENAEAGASRDHAVRVQTVNQFATEFLHPRRGWFDQFMDGINRVPRPAMALGTLGLFVAAMVDPEWFASRMVGITLVPEPLWWLLGAIVSFYFGARHQLKGQEFQRSLAQTMQRVPDVVAAREALAPDAPAPMDAPEVTQAEATPVTPKVADTGTDVASELRAITPTDNAALDDWRRQRTAARG